jgi:hypothetical protein
LFHVSSKLKYLFLFLIQLDEQIEDLFKSKRTTKNKTELGATTPAAAGAATAITSAAAATTAQSGTTPTQANIAALASTLMANAQQTVADKLKMAKGIADK